jgi:hypothetical protein
VTGARRYQVRTAVVEALQWTGSNIAEMASFAGSSFDYDDASKTGGLLSIPGSCWRELEAGEVAVRGVTGEYFIIGDQATFEENYAPVDAGEWQAVLATWSGIVSEPSDFDRKHALAPVIRIVRGSAIPVDGHLPASFDPGDVILHWAEFGATGDIAVRLRQAQAMAAGLNAAADLMTGPMPGAVLDPAVPLVTPCPEGFHWIGQSVASCDQCGLPAWGHEGTAALQAPLESPYDTPVWVLKPWGPGERQAMEANHIAMYGTAPARGLNAGAAS